jgi:CDP-glucose 4,6-dehydratase
MAPHVRAVVVVTSDKCYLNRGLTRGYREDDPLGGADPYSASKAAQEIVSASYRQSFFSDGPLLATVRAGNVIGGGDWSPERLVPDIIAALVSGSPVVLRYPDAVRPWQHVLEPLHAYLKIGANLLNGEAMVADAWNIGPAASDQRTVREIVERFAQIWDATSAWVRADDVQPHEAMALRLDAAKASSKLGIVPRLNLDAACEMTAHWYRSVTSGGNARSLCDADIARFMAH